MQEEYKPVLDVIIQLDIRDKAPEFASWPIFIINSEKWVVVDIEIESGGREGDIRSIQSHLLYLLSTTIEYDKILIQFSHRLGTLP